MDRGRLLSQFRPALAGVALALALVLVSAPAASAAPSCGDSLSATGARYYFADFDIPYGRGELRINLVDIDRFLHGRYGVFRASVAQTTRGVQDFGPFNAAPRGASAQITVIDPKERIDVHVNLLTGKEDSVLCSGSVGVAFPEFHV